MPPKKKAKVSGNVKSVDQVNPTSLEDLSPLQTKLKDWINKAYGMRHGGGDSLPWPVEKGGSLLEICQRCWQDKDGLLNASLALVQKMGILSESATTDDFEDKFMTAKDCLEEIRSHHARP